MLALKPARGRFRMSWALLAAAVTTAHAEDPLNWFGDPFIRMSHAVAGCPEPRGPRITTAERRVQAHHRAERGTTCWLQGDCDKPSAYAYDAQIAREIRARWRDDPARGDSTIWLTVQGRVVYFEGCVRDRALAAGLERFGHSVPHVLQSVAILAMPGDRRVPYATYRSP